MLLGPGGQVARQLEGADENGKPIVLTFGPGNAVRIRVGADAGEGTYAADWGKSPAHLDVDWGKRGKVETLVELTGEKLRMENNRPGQPRPSGFTREAVQLSKSR